RRANLLARGGKADFARQSSTRGSVARTQSSRTGAQPRPTPSSAWVLGLRCAPPRMTFRGGRTDPPRPSRLEVHATAGAERQLGGMLRSVIVASNARSRAAGRSAHFPNRMADAIDPRQPESGRESLFRASIYF